MEKNPACLYSLIPSLSCREGQKVNEPTLDEANSDREWQSGKLYAGSIQRTASINREVKLERGTSEMVRANNLLMRVAETTGCLPMNVGLWS